VVRKVGKSESRPGRSQQKAIDTPLTTGQTPEGEGVSSLNAGKAQAAGLIKIRKRKTATSQRDA